MQYKYVMDHLQNFKNYKENNAIKTTSRNNINFFINLFSKFPYVHVYVCVFTCMHMCLCEMYKHVCVFVYIAKHKLIDPFLNIFDIFNTDC